jgi:cytochrome P450
VNGPTIPDVFAESSLADPYLAYAELRRAGVVYDERNDLWVVARHADVIEALHDPERYSSAGGYAAFGAGEVGPRAGQVQPGRGVGLDRAFGSRVLIASDPPDHTMLRRIVSRGFTKRAIAEWELRAARCATGLVDAFEERLATEGRADFTRDIAIPLPVTLIADILGVPTDRMADFRRWSEALVGSLSNDVDLAGGGRDIAAMGAFFSEVVEERRREPRDDLISVIAQATPDGEQLSSFEVVMFCILLLVAGNETTTNLLGNMLHAFWAHPDQWDLLLADPSLAAGAVEEGLRYCGPIQGLFRKATAPASLGGAELPAGAHLYVCFAAANRDDAAFPDAARFDITRNVGTHVAFGHGIHFCLGAQLARMEARLVLQELARRGLELAPSAAAQPTANAILRGFRSIPVRLAGRVASPAV